LKDQKIFNRRELRLLYANKPELKPIKIPSLDDVNKVRVPSINEANLLNQPNLDQIIVQFLQKYEVNVVPRSVGAWNGWDTVSTLSSILSSREGSMSNIASTMFYANRSNQINSAAQDWGVWKRWVFGTKEKEFEQIKNEVIRSVNIHNYNATKEIEKKIEEAKLHNFNATKKVEEAIRKAKLHNEKNLRKLQDPKLKFYVAKLIETENFENALKRKKLLKILKILIISTSSISFLIICFVFINKQIIKNELKTTFAKGEKELEDGNYAKSRELFIKALTINPDSKKAKLGLTNSIQYYGQEKFNNGDFLKARNLCKEALKIDPDFKKAKLCLKNIMLFYDQEEFNNGDNSKESKSKDNKDIIIETINYTDALYKGEILNDEPHGQGTLTLNNGDQYVGGFLNGKKHGQGTYTWKNGDQYEGEWKNGDQYEGEWKNGKQWQIKL